MILSVARSAWAGACAVQQGEHRRLQETSQIDKWLRWLLHLLCEM